MARVRLTDGAVALAKKLMSTIAWPADVVPILSLRWSAGESDLTRDLNGEAVWKTTRPAGWVCDIASWVNVPNVNIQEHVTVAAGDIKLLLDPKASSAPGTFIVDEFAGDFNVELHAA